MPLPDFDRIILFASMSALLIVIPGPAVLYILSKSIEEGVKAGFISVLGIGVGALVHVLFAAIGISVILLTSSYTFNILKYAGAFYLLYLGIQKLRSSNSLSLISGAKVQTNKNKLFFEGMLINILNPKTAVFFLAFLPQFINPEKGQSTFQIIFLGLLFVGIAAISNSTYVLASSKISKWLKHNPSFYKRQHMVMAAVYFSLSVILMGMNNPG